MLLNENYRANERRANDLYPTPPALIEAALDLIHTPPTTALEPGAGDGRWGAAARRRWPDCAILGVEIRPGLCHEAYDGWLEMSFPGCKLECEKYGGYDLCFGNPPYYHVEATIRAALDLLSPAGTLLFLLPLRFLASQSRRDGLFREFPPKEVHVCSKRPSFSGDGKTNAVDFAIYLWHKPFRGVPALKWLKEGPSGGR